MSSDKGTTKIATINLSRTVMDSFLPFVALAYSFEISASCALGYPSPLLACSTASRAVRVFDSHLGRLVLSAAGVIAAIRIPAVP
jgi:hypothetical protein